MNVLAFAASLSKGSVNRRLIELVAVRLRARGAAVDLAEFGDFDMPLFDPELYDRDGMPPGALAFADRITAADGLVIASPEYLHSAPAALKSALEWFSRLKPVPVSGKVVLLASAANSPAGGVRGLIALRETLASMGVWVAPHVLAVGRAAQAFDGDRLKDAKLDAELDHMLDGFVRVVTALKRN